jgi:cyclopropane fatty-acyl-phospholipid synthase-like methyltransferase
MNSIVPQEKWDKSYENLTLNYDETLIQFKQLFNKYLVSNGTCFEVGCYPGNYSVYLGKKFNYSISGIDKTPHVVDRLPKLLKSEGVKVDHLYHEDFLDFKPSEKYDVVCSFGFIEHFLDLEMIFKKHIDLLKPSGILIITCPNFTRGQYLFHKLFDSENLKQHVINSMNLPRWRRILKENDMEVLCDGYYRTVDFWTNDLSQNMISQKGAGFIKIISKTINNNTDLPNRWFSPYLFSISKKVVSNNENSSHR